MLALQVHIAWSMALVICSSERLERDTMSKEGTGTGWGSLLVPSARNVLLE